MNKKNATSCKLIKAVCASYVHVYNQPSSPYRNNKGKCSGSQVGRISLIPSNPSPPPSLTRWCKIWLPYYRQLKWLPPRYTWAIICHKSPQGLRELPVLQLWEFLDLLKIRQLAGTFRRASLLDLGRTRLLLGSVYASPP